MERFASIMVILGAISYAMVGIILEISTSHGYPVQKIIVGMYLISFLILSILHGWSRKEHSPLSKKEFLLFLGLGFFTVAITYCFYNALRLVGVPIATLLLMQSSWITPLISVCIGKTKLTLRDVISTCFIVLGVFIAAFHQEVKISFLGILWGLGAALSYSVMILCSSNLAQEKNTLEKSSVISLGAFLISLILFREHSTVQFLSESMYWSLLYAVFATILPLILLSIGLKYISANLAGALITLEIPAAYFLSFIFLSEKITMYQILGCIVITLTISVPKIYSLYLNKKA